MAYENFDKAALQRQAVKARAKAKKPWYAILWAVIADAVSGGKHEHEVNKETSDTTSDYERNDDQLPYNISSSIVGPWTEYQGDFTPMWTDD